MFRVSHRHLVITPKAALHILGLLPSSAGLPTSLSLCKSKDSHFSSTGIHSPSHSRSSELGSSPSSLVSSRILNQLSPSKIKKAYIARTLLCHPDLFPDDPSANEKFQRLGEALRVALQVVKMHVQGPQGSEGGLCNSGSREGSIHDFMETLRRCMVAYHHHEKQEKQRKRKISQMKKSGKAFFKEGSKNVQDSYLHHRTPDTRLRNEDVMENKMNTGGNCEVEDDDEDPDFVDSVLHTPSLERIRDVCQRECAALAKTQELCLTIPSLLSGEHTALFDATAFFYTHYVLLTLSCVSRFIQHLPILVRRVVVQRKKKFRQKTDQQRQQSVRSSINGMSSSWGPVSASYAGEAGSRYPRAVSGLGTGNRPQTQSKIEDMAMKPLVLMGVLLFDISSPGSLNSKKERKENGEDEAKIEEENAAEEQNAHIEQSSTCPGVHKPSDIKVCRELQCCIYPTDTIEMIVDKLANWEQRSFERLQIELAMADVTALLSALMGLDRESSSSSSSRDSSSLIVVRPNLQASVQDALDVLKMVQSLTKEVCAHHDDSLDYVFLEDVVLKNTVWNGKKKEKHETGKEMGDVDDAGQKEKTKEYATPVFQSFITPPMTPSTEKNQYVEEAVQSWWWKRALSQKTFSTHSSSKNGSATPPLVGEREDNRTSMAHHDLTPSPLSSTVDTNCFLPSLIALCRTVSRLASPYIRGNIALNWPKQGLSSCDSSRRQNGGDEVKNKETAQHVPEKNEGEAKINADKKSKTSDAFDSQQKEDDSSSRHGGKNRLTSRSPPFQVCRHPMCCVAEHISFLVTVELVPDIFVFLSRWVAAMTMVLEIAEHSRVVLPDLLSLREKLVKEEFIPQQKVSDKNEGKRENREEKDHENSVRTQRTANRDSFSPNLGTSTPGHIQGMEHTELGIESEKQEKQAGKTEVAVEYDYRAPLRMFPRLFNMHTWQEKVFWERVCEHRVYLAQYAPMISPFQVFFECLPYDPSTSSPIQDGSAQTLTSAHPIEGSEGHPDDGQPAIPAGWVGHHEGDGSDQVIVTSSLLQSSEDFRLWLEDVVEQSSLQKEVERVLMESNISYVKREPSLPLTYFLSFLQVFRPSSAVRSIFEAHSLNSEVGWSIVVGTKCDIQQGKLYIPWHMDPTALIGLLQGNSAPSAQSIGNDGITEYSVSLLTAN